MKKLVTFLLLIAVFFAEAQLTNAMIHPGVRLPKDSVESSQLLSAFDNFLPAIERSNEENTFVLQAAKMETYILLDEIRGIRKSKKYEDDNFYKPYLINVAPLSDSTYLLEISYMGVMDKAPLLRASFEIIAHKTENTFLFSSPLLENTRYWNKKEVANNTFHYQTTLNASNAQKFTDLARFFDRKLRSENKITELYCCENLRELLALIGVKYKLDYNGRNKAVMSSVVGNKKLVVLGNHNSSFSEFDPHDLWHERLSLVISRRLVNKPVDEGCAYLYGGSWGISWEGIFEEFKKQIANNKDVDWMEYKENPVYFKTKGYSNSADYIVNALIVQKIEREKGFEGVWEFLNCGKFEKGNANYYQALEKLTGITRATYNEEVWKLISAEI